MGKVATILQSLQDRKITAEQAGKQINEVVTRTAPKQRTLEQIEKDMQAGLGPTDPESFLDVSVAYDTGKITEEQYRIIQEQVK